MRNRNIILLLFVAKLSWAWSNCTIISPTTTNYYVETPAWMYPLSYSPCETCLAYIITDVHQPITSHTVEHGATTRYIAPYWDWNFHRTRTVTVVEDAPQTPRSQIQTWFANAPPKSASPVEGDNGLAYNYCFEYIITYVVRELNNGFDYLVSNLPGEISPSYGLHSSHETLSQEDFLYCLVLRLHFLS